MQAIAKISAQLPQAHSLNFDNLHLIYLQLHLSASRYLSQLSTRILYTLVRLESAYRTRVPLLFFRGMHRVGARRSIACNDQ